MKKTKMIMRSNENHYAKFIKLLLLLLKKIIHIKVKERERSGNSIYRKSWNVSGPNYEQ
jgi:hypothetical protein